MSADSSIRWLPVREVGDVRMGKQLSPSGREGAGQFPYLRVANVHEGRIDYTDVKTMTFSAAEREAYGLRPGDVLLNEGQSLELVGRSALYRRGEGEFCYQNTLVRFRPGAHVIPQYAQLVFQRWLATGVFATIAKQTTSIAHLGGERFASLSFPLRPLAEQRRIIEVMDAVAAQERAIEVSVAKVTAMRAGVLDSLLSELSWDRTLGDVTDGVIRNGYSPVESPSWTGVQMLGLGCLTVAGFSPNQLKNAPSLVTMSHGAVLRDGDLLMSRANTRDLVGLAGVYQSVGTPCIYPDLMMRLSPIKGCLTNFLAVVLASTRARRHVRIMAQGTSESMVKISAKAVRQITVPLPEMKVQRKVLGILDCFTEQLKNESCELAKLRTLGAGLTQDLLVVHS